ncbi:MAG: hypothetical protein ABR606_14790 [Vicinamibacterales bacterium]
MTDRGFTLVELLIATLLTLTILAIALAIVDPARSSFERDAAGAEVAQRLRTGLQALGDDLRGAGAGAAIAEQGRLADSLPVVEPMIHLDPTAPADGRFRAVRIITVPAEAAQARLREALVSGDDPLRLKGPPACPGSRPACGFEVGHDAILFDRTAIHDVVEVATVTVDAGGGSITTTSPLSGRYAVGAAIAQIEETMYGLAPDGEGGQRLVKVSGAGATMPLLDHVVDFTVDVYGDARPPLPSVQPLASPSYGPRPPVPGQDDERDEWGAGENCTIAVSEGGARAGRLPTLGGVGTLVKLTPDMLVDGPWCPGSPAGPNFDADLFRIRRVDLRLRVEVASAALRGPAGRLFRRPGAGSRSASWVPDGELRLTVVPRNLRQP